MDLPSDLREGWYWVRWGVALPAEAVLISRHDGEWFFLAAGEKYRQRLSRAEGLTALEPVAPPSWERGE